MTNPAFNPEDPRLTAFVLGEIDDSDRAEIEQLLETSPEAQAAVKEIEETIGVLKEGLASEPTPELTPEQRAAVEEQLAGPTLVTTSEPEAPGRSKSGKFVGGLLSLAALGVMAAFVVPEIDDGAPLRQLMSSKVADTSEPKLVALNSFSEAEEAFDADTSGALSDDMISAETQSTRPRDEIFSDGDAPRMTLASRIGQRQAERSKLERQLAQPQDEGRSESEFAKRDSAQAGQSGDGEKSASFFSSLSQSKDVSRPYSQPSDSPQRLIADSGSRPGRNDGLANSDSFSLPEGRSKSGPRTTVSVDPKSGNPHTRETVVRNRILVAPGDLANPYLIDKSKGRLEGGVLEGGADKSNLSAQVAGVSGAKNVGGDGVGNGQPAKPQSREAIVNNRKMFRSDDPASPTAVAGVTAQPESAPALANGPQLVSELSDQSLASNKNVSELAQKERALHKQKTAPTSGGLAGGLASTDSDRSGEALKAAVDALQLQTEAKMVADKTVVVGKKLEVLAEQIRESQTQLAVIDSGATRRVRVRGFGLEGRDLQEQLQKYSVGLSLARTTQERMPDARQSGYGSEYYAPIVENNFIVPVIGDKEKSLSTISVDVDTASYANMRRFLNRDQLPPADSVRIEELVNYFKYNYPEPEGDEPFSVKTELASCPWQPSHRLAMVGLKAKTIDKSKRPPTNLVFLLDVSGSMRASNKLPLVQQSMRLLVEEMTEDDRVSIVTYASNAGVRLQSTLGSKKQEILNAINGLRAGGSTNGEGGIRMAYDEANRHYFQGGSNRVILCSDGDFNVGKSSDGDLVELIQEKAASGVFLSVFGFGMGNLKDAKLEKLADKGNGHYGYIDNLNEARKVFQDELVGTLYTVAKDVKLQVEFNPATVGAYRLIGYENRKLAAQDFTDDTKDAGEIGSGHTVTALYEIIPKQVLLEQPIVEGLKYQAASKESAADEAGTDPSQPEDKPADATDAQTVQEELLTVKLRYKKPDEEVSQPVQRDFALKDVSITGKQISAASNDLMFAASVASFGMNLRGSKYRGNWGFAEALETAQGAQSDFDQAQRAEFVQLVQRAMRITGQQVGLQPRTDEGTTARPGELGATEARIKASVDGKYRRLVKKIEVRDDFQRFGAFNDYGPWDGTEYLGHKDLPPGNWVYVYPNWYIWAEAATTSADTNPEGKSADEKPAVK